MSDLTPLREAVDTLAGRAPSPDFGELKRRATRRGQRRVALVVAASAAVIAVGGGLAIGSVSGSDRVAPVEEPTTPSPEPPKASESAEPEPGSGDAINEILRDVPGWGPTVGAYPDDYDYAFTGPCSRDSLLKGSNGAADGGIPGATNGGLGKVHFKSEAQASDEAATFVQNLESCTATEWQTQPIAQTGAVLATSPDAVVWIQQKRHYVDVLQVRTTDGPPPEGVQVAVAEWMADYITMDEQRRPTHS